MGRRKTTTETSYEMSVELQEESVDWLGEYHKDIIAYLKEKGILTMGDVVDHWDELPDNYIVRINAKLMFGIDDYK